MKDISSAEEDVIPLPKYWERAQSIANNPHGHNHNIHTKSFFYRNISTGLESFEHPYVHQALEVARSMKLPDKWVVKEAIDDDDGTIDYYYFNPEIGLSLWDPPLLRLCLSDILGADGHSSAALWILTEDTDNLAAVSFNNTQTYEEEEVLGFDRVASAYSRFKSFQDGQEDENNNNSSLDRLNVDDLNNDNDSIASAGNIYDRPTIASNSKNNSDNNKHNSTNNDNDNNNNNFSIQDVDVDFDVGANDYTYGDGDQDDYQSVSDSPSVRTDDMSSKYRNTSDEQEFVKTWETFRRSRLQVPDPNEKLVNVSARSKPPKNLAGINMLKADCRNANTRVHELLSRLRAGLCEQHGLQAKVIDPFLDEEFSKVGGNKLNENGNGGGDGKNACYEEKDLLRMAADIISKLRKHPERLISMMTKVFKAGDGGMPYASFIILHRILHPFSADNSITTSVILNALSSQLQELANISEMYADIDPKYIMTRSIFMKDPEIALAWDPLSQPMPIVPNVAHETMFSCFLRIYSIRRDVSSFFRTVWRPALPAILKTISDKRIDRRQFFINLMTCVCKIIDGTYDDKAVAMFPATATAICRTLYDIGGFEPVHHYLLNFLIMPNLLKIVTGDHNSIENELNYKKDELNGMLNSYFDCNVWWPREGFHAATVAKSILSSSSSSAPSSPVLVTVSPLYWLLWRIYTGSAFLDIHTIDNLSSVGFFAGGPQFDFSGFPDPKLRVLLVRTKRKLESACRNILSLPLDSFGSKFLGNSQFKGFEKKKSASLSSSSPASAWPDTESLLESRAVALLVKPDEMMSLLVASRRELAFLFHSAGVDIELQKKTHKSTLYRLIAEYLVANDYIPELSDNEFLVVPFHYTDDSLDLVEEDEKLCLFKYDQLSRSLVLASRYEQSLLYLISIVETNSKVHIEDILTDDSWLVAPEFECNFRELSQESKQVQLNKQHTTASLPKQRRECNLGLKAHDVFINVEKVGDLFVTHVPAIEEYTTKKLFENIHKGLRFGSIASNASSGTQMFSPKKPMTKSAALPRFDKPLSHRELNRNNKYITKIDVDQKSKFLAQTEADFARIELIKKREDTYKFTDDIRNFKAGLRSYSPSAPLRRRRPGSSSSAAAGVVMMMATPHSNNYHNSNNVLNSDYSPVSSGRGEASPSVLTDSTPRDVGFTNGAYSPYSKNQRLQHKGSLRSFKHPEVSGRARSPTESSLHRVVSTDLWYNHDKYVLELRPDVIPAAKASNQRNSPGSRKQQKSRAKAAKDTEEIEEEEVEEDDILSDSQIELFTKYVKSCCYDDSTNEVTWKEFDASFVKHKYALHNKGLELKCRGLMEKLEYLLIENKMSVEAWFKFSDTSGALDSSSDGKVSFMELFDSITKLCSNLRLQTWSKQDVYQLLTYMDPYNRSEISLEEAELAFRKHLSPPEYLETLKSCTPIVSKLQGYMQQKSIGVNDLFNLIDKDSNGTINIDEMKSALKQMFGKMQKEKVTSIAKEEEGVLKANVIADLEGEEGGSITGGDKEKEKAAGSEAIAAPPADTTKLSILETGNVVIESKSDDKDSANIGNMSSNKSSDSPAAYLEEKQSIGSSTVKLHDNVISNYVEVEESYRCVFDKGNILREGHWIGTPAVQEIKKGEVVQSVGYGYILANGFSTKRLKVKLKSGGGYGWCSATLAMTGQEVVMELYAPSVPQIDELLRSRSNSPSKVHIFHKDELTKKISSDGFVVTKYNSGGGFKQKKLIYNESAGDLVWSDVGRRMPGFSSDSKISLKSIEEVRRGTQTDVFKPFVRSIDPALACSMITADRTLDLVFDSSQSRNLFLRTLTALTDKIDHHIQIL